MKFNPVAEIKTKIVPLVEGGIPTALGLKMKQITNNPIYHKEGKDYYLYAQEKYIQEEMLLKEGKKYDGVGDGSEMKLRYDLIPPEIIEELAKVYTYGAKKYGENQWQYLPAGKDRYFGALMRHMQAHRKGEKVDPESGLLHLSHALWNVGAILWLQENEE